MTVFASYVDAVGAVVAKAAAPGGVPERVRVFGRERAACKRYLHAVCAPLRTGAIPRHQLPMLRRVAGRAARAARVARAAIVHAARAQRQSRLAPRASHHNFHTVRVLHSVRDAKTRTNGPVTWTVPCGGAVMRPSFDIIYILNLTHIVTCKYLRFLLVGDQSRRSVLARSQKLCGPNTAVDSW